MIATIAMGMMTLMITETYTKLISFLGWKGGKGVNTVGDPTSVLGQYRLRAKSPFLVGNASTGNAAIKTIERTRRTKIYAIMKLYTFEG
jgi:hypothetical protein